MLKFKIIVAYSKNGYIFASTITNKNTNYEKFKRRFRRYRIRITNGIWTMYNSSIINRKHLINYERFNRL